MEKQSKNSITYPNNHCHANCFKNPWTFSHDQTDNILSIQPNEPLLQKLKDWHMFYADSLPEDIRKNYSEQDILSDLHILMGVYFQTYCGYFTYADLDTERSRADYLIANKQFIEKTKKTACLRIDIEDNQLDHIHWECTPASSSVDFVFTPSSPKRQWKNNILAALHLHNVIYENNRLSALEIFKHFNYIEKRKSSAWFKFTKEYLKPQQEKRLIFYLPDYKVNSSHIACTDIFPNSTYHSLEEALFYSAVSTLKYAKDNFPEYVYLKIQHFDFFTL